MKIRKAIKLAVVGSLAVLPGLAGAGTPAGAGFGNWTVDTNGNVVGGAPGGTLTCAAATGTSAGFLQRQCQDTGGNKFIQTINTATGFTDESFVAMGSTAGGIADKQNVFESGVTASTGADFSSQALLTTGGFEDQQATSGGRIDLQQQLTNTVAADTFTASFHFQEGNFGASSTAGGYDGTHVNIDLGSTVGDSQFTGTFALSDYAIEFGAGDSNAAAAAAGRTLTLTADMSDGSSITQNFVQNEASGSAVSQSGAGNGLGFSAGDTLVQLRIGQDVGGVGVFGLNDFVNESASTETGVDSFTAVPFPTGFYPITYTDGGSVF